MTRNTTRIGMALWGCALLLAGPLSAQELLNEQFTGGASTTGFTITQDGGNCQWAYAPGALVPNNFNRDNDGGALPSGAGFDSDFVFIDSDECFAPSTTTTVHTYLTSAAFDASATGNYILRFSHQFQARLASYARVEAFDGTTWNEVITWTTDNVGYPNPSTLATLDLTTALNGASNAQIRFEFSSGWDWWWALDNVVVTRTTCAFPTNLAVNAVTQTGAALSWDDNGSTGYTWAVTTGAYPDGTNEVSTGNGTNTTASGLSPGTAYVAFVRSECDGGSNSGYGAGVPFFTAIANDECATASALTVNPDHLCGTVTHGTVAGATDSGVETTCFGTPDDDVWYSFIATATSHYVDLVNVSGSVTDLYHAVWTGSCGALTLVPNSCSDADELLVTDLTVGQTYYVQVYTYTDEPGQNTQFDVCIGTVPPPPANDECTSAVTLTVNADENCGTVTPGTTESSTDSNITTDCGGTADDDVWYKFTATATAHDIGLLNVTGSTTDMYMALWSGACNSLTLVPNSCSDPEQETVTGLTMGATYYLQVYTYTNTPGQTSTFNVCIGTASTAGVQEVAAAPILTVAPDPASTQLFLTATNGKAVNVRVFDMTGHLVIDHAFVKQLDIAQLDAGTYTLVALDAKGSALARTLFVKQ